MSNIISRYKAILPVSLFALSAQGVMAQDASEADTINVAFRKADARDVITPVSTVKVKNLLEKNYNTYSLDNMQALAAGYNGSLWNQGDALVLIDGVPRDANNVLPTEIEDITFLKGASAVVLYGSRAAKGAILITTKRGKVEPLKITARANYQMSVAKSFPTYLACVAPRNCSSSLSDECSEVVPYLSRWCAVYDALQSGTCQRWSFCQIFRGRHL